MNRFEKLSFQRQFLLFTIVIVIAVAVLAVTAEGIVRVRQWVKYGGLWGIEETYTKDPSTGLRVPVAGGRFGSIKINSLGFRGPEIDRPKPDSVIRIAFLGASTTYCAEVSSNEMTWPHLVWKELSDHWSEVKFDYINAGVPGYGARDSLRRLKDNIAPLGPDIVVIYHAINDLSYNSFKLAKQEGIVQQRTEQTLSWPSNYSLLWYLLEKNLKILLSQKAQTQNAESNLTVNRKVLAEPFRADMQALIKGAQELADAVVVVSFSHHVRREQSKEKQMEAAETNLYYMPYLTVEGILEGFETYNQVIREIAKSMDVHFIGQEYLIPGDKEHFVDSVHFTDRGSMAMAKRVVKGLIHSDALNKLIARR